MPKKDLTATTITPEWQELWSKVQSTHPEANFLQSPEWGRANELMGYQIFLEHFGSEAWCQMILKDARRGRYLEIPGGPLLDWNDKALVHRMFTLVKKCAKAQKCAFVRLRPQLRASDAGKLEGLGFKKAPMHLHAEHTVMLDLTLSEDELLGNMRRQTRYEVRRAGKLGLKVESFHDQKHFEEFHAVQAETASRQHFVPPNLKTLLAEREAFGKDAALYIAKDPAGAPIAYGLILQNGAEAEYFEAASTELNYKLPGAYALQWHVIKDLKKQGITRYNLWGIAPMGAKKHRYAGVTTFKTGFGGEIVEFVPARDLVISWPRYLFNWLIESIRRKKRHL